MNRVLSGVQPTGDIHLGNYLGAFRNWVADQDSADAFFCIVDLHALTVDHDPATLARSSLETAIVLLASGLDPARCTLFLQSHVHEHAQLSWVLECSATMGELGRMTQFKDKGRGRDAARVGLFTYPVLMAADILLYDADVVPVGDDQRQHLELARDLATRFNNRYGTTFVVPSAQVPKVGARVMDLADPTRKMSKTGGTPQGTVLLLDDPATIEKKIKRAVTDTETSVRFDPVAKPGVSNLLELLGAATGTSPERAAGPHTSYGSLKMAAAEAVIEMLAPVQKRYRELSDDPAEVTRLLAAGADKARAVAGATFERVCAAVGLLPP